MNKKVNKVNSKLRTYAKILGFAVLLIQATHGTEKEDVKITTGTYPIEKGSRQGTGVRVSADCPQGDGATCHYQYWPSDEEQNDLCPFFNHSLSKDPLMEKAISAALEDMKARGVTQMKFDAFNENALWPDELLRNRYERKALERAGFKEVEVSPRRKWQIGLSPKTADKINLEAALYKIEKGSKRLAAIGIASYLLSKLSKNAQDAINNSVARAMYNTAESLDNIAKHYANAADEFASVL